MIGPPHVVPHAEAATKASTADALEAERFRGFMREWATGIAVVTGMCGDRPVGCTVNALLSVSLHPPLLLVSLSRLSHTLGAITRGGRFGVNVLGWEQRHLAQRFSLADEGDRFTGVGHRVERGVPVLDGVTAVAAFDIERTVPVGDHVLVLGRPAWCADGGAEPVLFYRGQYRRALP